MGDDEVTGPSLGYDVSSADVRSPDTGPLVGSVIHRRASHAPSELDIRQIGDGKLPSEKNVVRNGIVNLDAEHACGEDEYDEPLTGVPMTLMNMIKAMLGNGILAMPFAFKNSGLALGVICIVVFGIICTHCMQILVTASQYFGQKLEKRTTNRLSYPEVVRLAFQHSSLSRWTSLAHNLVLGFIVVTQIGFCCIYVVFVARTVDNVLSEYKSLPPINIRYITLMSTPVFAGMVLIRNLKRLAPFAMAANIITLLSLIVVYQEELRHLPSITSVPQFGNISNFPRFFGAAIYSFEGISCVLPVENKMRERAKFGGIFGILNQAMFVVVSLYATTGFLGYWAYGNAAKDSITYNLPHHPVYMVAKLAMAAAVFISYAIQLYVPIKIMMPWLQRRWPGITDNAQRQARVEYLLRFVLMIITIGFALFIPHLAEFIGLVGAFGSSYLALILPPVIDLLYQQVKSKFDLAKDKTPTYGHFHEKVVKNLLIIGIGLMGFFLGTYLAISDIIDKFRLDAFGNTTARAT